MTRRRFLAGAAAVMLLGRRLSSAGEGIGARAREGRLANLRQLTAGGQNAEAYFSWDGTKPIFQFTRDGYPCDQIYTMNADGTGDAVALGIGHPRGVFPKIELCSQEVRDGARPRSV